MSLVPALKKSNFILKRFKINAIFCGLPLVKEKAGAYKICGLRSGEGQAEICSHRGS
jgi:hypothetical protein